MSPTARAHRILLVPAFFLFTACGASGVAPAEQNGTNHDAGHDAGHDHDTDDEETDTGDDKPVESAQIITRGSDGFLLRGTVLTPDEVLDPGEVLIEDELITCVASDCSAQASEGSFTVIETGGVISPGLIDAHNHLPYNFLPPWIPSPQSSFSNRYQWIDDAGYEAHIAPYTDNRNANSHFCPASKWGELRSLIHATTTIQGQSLLRRCIIGGVRNADLSYHHLLGYDHFRSTIASPRDITDAQAENYIESFEAQQNPATRFAVHMTEGYADNHIESEFDSFAGRDTRNNRHQGISLLDWGTAVLIHSIALTPAQLEEVYLTDSMLVWSPSSNFALYGVTAPIDTILDWNITTGLGPDWTLSGTFEMLSEMRVAHSYGVEQGFEALTPKRIWDMATWEGAIVVGLHDHIGKIEAGMRADIALFGLNGPDPYQAVLDSRAADVELVLIDGQAHFGNADLEEIARNNHCDDLDACGTAKFLCVKEDDFAPDMGHETLEDIRTQLVNILEGLDDAPEEEQYGRGDELLDLVICDI